MKRKIYLKLCLFIAGLCLLFEIFNFLYVEYDDWSRIVWHNYYKEDSNIDNLYLGSSLVFCSVDPFILDELNNKNNFTLATNSQPLNGSYYIIKEVSKRHDVQTVYIGLSHDMMTGDKANYKARNCLYMNWRSTDFMTLSPNKLAFSFSMSSSAHYVETFLPFTRYKDRLFDINYVRENVRKKMGDTYRNYQFYSENSNGEIIEYKDKGEIFSSVIISDEIKNQDLPIRDMNEYPITDIAEEYLRKIIEYCQSEDIEVVFFTVPMHENYLLSLKNYDTYIAQVNDILKDYNVPYYNFNLCKQTYLPIHGDSKYFEDLKHLNSNGSALFTSALDKAVNGTPETINKMFFTSCEEKINTEFLND